MYRSAIIGFAAFLMSCGAETGWQPLPKGISYDPSRTTQDGGITTTWIRVIPEQTTLPNEAYRISRVEMDCSGQRFRMVYTAAYSADQNLIVEDHVPAQWSGMVPNTRLDPLVQRIC